MAKEKKLQAKVDTEGLTKAEIETKLNIARGRIQEWLRHDHKHDIGPLIKPRWDATQGQTARFNRLNCYQIYLAATMLNGRASKIDVFDSINNKYIENLNYLARYEKQTTPTPVTNWQGDNDLPKLEPGKYVSYYIIDLQQIRDLVDKKLI